MTEFDISGIGLFPAQNMDYYREMTRDLTLSLDLSRDECAVVLKAYDRGVAVLDQEELPLLDAVIAKLKFSIHP